MAFNPNTSILLNADGSVGYTTTTSINERKIKNALYYLLPNPDDPNFLLVECSKFMYLRRARICYEMSMYVYSENDSTEDRLDSSMKEVVVHNPCDFYISLWNILKLRTIMTLFYESNLDFENIEGFSIGNVLIDVFFDDGSLDTFKWDYKNDISIQSNFRKLSSKLCDHYHIPWRSFRNRDTVFKIYNDCWDIVDYDKIKIGDLVGLISDCAMNVEFMNWTPEYFKIMDETLDVEINGFSIENIVQEYPMYETHKHERSFLSKIDTGSIPDLAFAISFIISWGYNDKFTVLSNLHYICKYVESYISWNMQIPIEDCECFIMLSYVFVKKNASKRIEVTITKNNMDYL